jgi:hypothetical protein
MGKYAIIKDGVVINAVLSEPTYAASQGWIELPDGMGIGCSYANGQFVDNRPAPEIVVPPAPTKEQLLAQLQALQAQIEALG